MYFRILERFLEDFEGIVFFSIKNVFPMHSNCCFFIKEKECIII
jgi:hypothetical protein